MRLFVVASAALLVGAAFLLGSMLTRTLHSQALGEERTSLAQYVDGVLGPVVVHDDNVVTTRRLSQTILRALRGQPDVVSVKVWRADGTLAWTSLDASRIGRRFPLDSDLGEAIRGNRAVAGVFSPDSEGEDGAEARLGFKQLVQVYAPLESADHTRAIGAYEIYAKPQHTEAFIASRKRLIWFAILAVFLTLYGALALLVRNASSTLRGQASSLQARSRELMDSYRRLEESSLEAIESLNATVDAKDPYTAGHSARVQRIALAVAEELGLPPQRMDAVRFGGLFHDIGKIAVPDSILTKPAALNDEEFTVIQRHPADGAEIVSHFSRLHEAVPLIRHHHERWDGKGYPDRLSAEQIPLEACVVGLADAWDAMTTDRPYRVALTLEEAAAEVRNCRGSQFSPSVVDAFFAAFRRRPALFEADDEYEIAATA